MHFDWECEIFTFLTFVYPLYPFDETPTTLLKYLPKTDCEGKFIASAIAIDNARCYCTVTGWNNVKVGMITGSPYSGTAKVTNCYVGGYIDFGNPEGLIPDDAGGSKTGWVADPRRIDQYSYYEYIYGKPISDDYQTIVNTVVTTDGCGYLVGSVDAEPKYDYVLPEA